jgi:ketosteroid isomerase-like protein
MNEHNRNTMDALPARRRTLKRLMLAMGLGLPAARQSHAQAKATVVSADPTANNDPSERATAAVRAVIDRYADAWRKGDFAAIQDCYHADFTLHYFGRSSLAGTHAGKARALAALVEFSRRTRRQLVRIDATMAGPERGAIIATERVNTDDTEIEMQRVLVYSVADNRLRACWVYDSDPTELDRILSRS